MSPTVTAPGPVAIGFPSLHTLMILGADGGEEKCVFGLRGRRYPTTTTSRVLEDILVCGMCLPRAINAIRFFYVDLFEKLGSIVKGPSKALPAGNCAVEHIGYLESPGRTYVGLLEKDGVGLLCDARSGYVAQAT
ncbi:MAG: hypothetical protein QXK88_06935 [Desulfurococcaceae archaeon]